jgi:hypothetical protein
MNPAERIERSQWDFFWVPDDVEICDRPEVAAIRSDRPVPHLNMVVRTRATAAQLARIVPEMREWIGTDHARWLVANTIDTSPIEAALTADGWQSAQLFEARAIRPADYRGSLASDLSVVRVETLERLRECHAITERAFEREIPVSDAQLARELEHCRDPRGRVHRFVVCRGGRGVSSGGLNWFADLRLGFLWAGATLPDERGRGAYTALVAARMNAAEALGAEWVGLYARHDTSAPIVARQGFDDFGRMQFWKAVYINTPTT